MTHVSAIFNPADLSREVEAGNVRVQTHPAKDLTILNYSPQCSYNRAWNDVTLACRGLIPDTEQNVVARCLGKFFNSFEPQAPHIPLDAPVSVMDKVDGSYVQLYFDGDQWAMSTRGSFMSEQAVWATKVLHDKYLDSIDTTLLQDVTFYFEAVYGENRIVLFYPFEDLVLLGGIWKETGQIIAPGAARFLLDWPGRVVEEFSGMTYGQALNSPPRDDAEGFVIRYDNELVKTKYDWYVSTHKIVTELNSRTIWAGLSEGKTLADFLEFVPDEWHDYLTKEVNTLFAAYRSLEYTVKQVYSETVRGTTDRKSFAQKAVQSPYAKFLFLLHDDKSIEKLLWAHIKPPADREELVNDSSAKNDSR